MIKLQQCTLTRNKQKWYHFPYNFEMSHHVFICIKKKKKKKELSIVSESRTWLHFVSKLREYFFPHRCNRHRIFQEHSCQVIRRKIVISLFGNLPRVVNNFRNISTLFMVFESRPWASHPPLWVVKILHCVSSENTYYIIAFHFPFFTCVYDSEGIHPHHH